MALNISGADIGYDQNEVQTAINNLNTVCIADTIELMTSGMADLRTAVDAVWIGQSAESFKNNMETDKTNIINGLNDSETVISAQFADIISTWDDVDQNIVTERGA